MEKSSTTTRLFKTIQGILIFLICCLVVSHTTAQSHIPYIVTQRYMNELTHQHASIQTNRDAFEFFIQEFAASWQPDTVVIPVVFHLILPPNSENSILGADISAQLDQLNAAFGEPNFPSEPNIALDAEQFREKSARPGIQFCLATITPNGATTSGVNDLTSIKPMWGMNDSLKLDEKGGVSPWDPAHYLNIWVAPLEGENAGYAQMPGGPSATDGIVISPSFFAKVLPTDTLAFKYQKGNVLAHLVGSYLNLYELWDETTPCGDDFVSDTPIHNAPNYNKTKYKHVSTCGDNPAEMTMNMMDLSPDEERYMFTLGQVVRMNAMLAPNGPRGSLRDTPPCTGFIVEEGLQDRNSEDTTGAAFRIFPNPVSTTLTIQIHSEVDAFLDLTVFDLLGQIVYTKAEALKKGEHRYFLDTKLLYPGTYTAVANLEGRTHFKKFVVER